MSERERVERKRERECRVVAVVEFLRALRGPTGSRANRRLCFSPPLRKEKKERVAFFLLSSSLVLALLSSSGGALIRARSQEVREQRKKCSSSRGRKRERKRARQSRASSVERRRKRTKKKGTIGRAFLRPFLASKRPFLLFFFRKEPRIAQDLELETEKEAEEGAQRAAFIERSSQQFRRFFQSSHVD